MHTQILFRVPSIAKPNQMAKVAAPLCAAKARVLAVPLLLCCILMRAEAQHSVEPSARSVEVSTKLASSSRKAMTASPVTRLSLQQSAERVLEFVPNRGQAPGQNLFVAQGAGGLSLGLQQEGLQIVSAIPLPVKDASRAKPEAADGGAKLPDARRAPAFMTESVRVQFVGADPHAKVEGLGETGTRVNYVRGKNPSQWQTGLPSYERVRYSGLYPGIDLVYYGERQHHLEYDLVVAPGADPGRIRLRVASKDGASVDRDGNLLLDGKRSGVSLMRPVLYQNVPNGKRMIAGSFVKLPNGDYGFSHEAYDHSKPLVIDPTIKLVYATYAGGIHNDEATDMTLDAAGNAYVTGWSASQDFPVSSNALQTTRSNIGSYVYDAVVMKFDPSGALLFSTFLGGSQNEQGEAIRVDPSGLIYLGGYTNSSDYPVTANALQSKYGGGNDAFFAVLSNDGSQLIYSTYLGGAGDESINRMIQDSTGALWLTGVAAGAGLPVTTGVYQTAPKGADNGFVAKVTFNQTKTQPLIVNALTFLGGSGNSGEFGFSDIAQDATGNVYVTGGTNSTDYPVTANAYLKPSTFTLSTGCYNSPSPLSIATVSELTADLKTLVYSTVLGGKTEDQNGYPDCNQFGRTVHPDNAGNIWIGGTTGMQDFPTTGNALSKQLNGNGYAGVDDFLTELTPGTNATTLVYSSYIGGSQFDYGSRTIWDANKNIWMISNTASTDWPGMVAGTSLQATSGGGYDTVITEFQPDGTKILYATYLGGSGDEDVSGSPSFAFDANANLHLAGATSSTNYPVTAGALQTVFANGEKNPDGNDMYYAVLGSGGIGAVGPVTGGSTGDTTVTIGGAGYQSGATCSLVQGSTTIASVAASVNAGGTSISCTFALAGASIGAYNVVINNPDGSSFTRQGGFTVTSGGAPNLSISILGRPILRTGYASTFYVNVTNSGNQNAYMTPLWITLPKTLTFAINGQSAADSALLGNPSGDNVAISQMIPLLRPGQTTSIPLQLTSPTDSTGLAINATLQSPWFATVAEANAAAASSNVTPGCIPSSVNRYASNCLGTYIADLGSNVVPLVARVVPEDGKLGTPEPKPLDYLNGQNQGQSDATAGKTPDPGPLNSTTIFHFDGYNFGFAIGTLNKAADAGGKAGSGPGTGAGGGSGSGCAGCSSPPAVQPGAGTTPPAGTGVDPNYKSGPTGDGSASQFVRGTSALTYAVGFENEPTALLPAAQVFVTDQLDSTKVDLSTLTLGTITIGSNVITLPTGTNNYNTTYALSSSLSVRIQGSLDTETGQLKWTFTTIDPTTGLPPSDPTLGFLPPDKDGIIGQGSVVYSVMPLATLATGTQVTNSASIVFDRNAAIATPTWTNTLDFDPPVSKVTALPTSVASAGASTPFTVQWSGTDKGSGVAGYTIYVSDNGTGYTAWQTGVKTTSATYTGQTNHTYAFYSIASDAAGNAEAAKSVPDSTTVISGAAATTTLKTSAATVPVGTQVTFTATVTGSSTTPTGTVMFMNGTATLGSGMLTAGVATYVTSSLAAGSYSITAVYSGDSVYSGSTSAALTETVQPPSFTMTANPTTLTVTSGSSGSASLMLTPTGGFAQTVSFSCSGLPAHAACSFSPSTVTLSGTATASTTVTVSTSVASLVAPRQRWDSGDSKPLLCFVLLGGAGLWGLGSKRRRLLRRKRWGLLSALLAVVLSWGAVLVSGCSSSSPGSSSKTPTGVSTVTILATGGGQTQMAPLTVTVQ